MKKRAIILDLDDTIFRTKSMDSQVFKPFFDRLYENLAQNFSEDTIRLIMDDLWRRTWDSVLKEYNIPPLMFTECFGFLENLESKLNISPYADYRFLHTIPCSKYLVTTSLTSLQQSKIRALKIENDFAKIVINDTFRTTKTKLDIFKELVEEFGLIPETTYVIGDNPESEIKAGNELDMITIQILRDGVSKGDNARYYIKSFEELGSIIIV